MSFFLKLVDETQIFAPPVLGTINQKKYWSFYPSEPIPKICFNVRHPVLQTIYLLNKEIVQFLGLKSAVDN